MFFEKLREAHKKQNISVPFSEIEKSFNEYYEIRFKSRIPNPEDLLLNETADSIVQNVFDYYVEKNSLTVKTPEWENYRQQLKTNSFFKNKKYVCIAPYNTMRFDFNGELSVCCQNKTHLLGYYPETTPEKAWTSREIKILRDKLQNFDFTHGCTVCARHILAGNARNSILGGYEEIIQEVNTSYPLRLIFQLNNTCNYACIMCSEEYSSTIHKLRGCTSPHKKIYDDNFLIHIEPFLKTAKRVEFIGGEPFLIPFYYKMWNLIKDINPNLDIDVITNGSVYNSKVEQVLKDLPNMFVHVSLDSLNPKTYAYVRRNGNLENVLSNIDKMFKLKDGNSISMSPLIQTVYEIPDMVNFCNNYNVDLSIRNVVSLISGPEGFYHGLYECGAATNPLKDKFAEEPIKEFRLKTLSKKEKLKIKYYLLSKTYPKRYQDVVLSFVNFLTNYDS